MTNENPAGTFTLGGDTVVGRIGFGAMQLPKWPFGTPTDRDTALAVLQRAVELGVNHIDTAAFYVTDGVAANDLIREALHPYPDDLLLATKVGPRFGASGLPTESLAPSTPEQLREDVERNLTELGVDRIGLVNLRLGTMEASDEDPSAHIEALAALQAEGLIGHIGISNVTPGAVAKAQRVTSIVAVQNLYNAVHRGDDALIDSLAGQGVAYVPFFPLGGHDDPDYLDTPVLTDIAKRHEATPAQIALAWTLRRSPSVLLIPGTGSVGHLEENMAAGALRLTDEDAAAIDAIGG